MSVSGYEAQMYRNITAISNQLKEISTTLSSYSVEWFSISNSLKRIATALEKANEPCENNYYVDKEGGIMEMCEKIAIGNLKEHLGEDYNATYESEEMNK